MTVKELITSLMELPPETPIYWVSQSRGEHEPELIGPNELHPGCAVLLAGDPVP